MIHLRKVENPFEKGSNIAHAVLLILAVPKFDFQTCERTKFVGPNWGSFENTRAKGTHHKPPHAF